MGFGSDLLDRRPLGRRPPAAHGGGREKGRERGGKVVCGGWFGGEAEEEEGDETEATARGRSTLLRVGSRLSFPFRALEEGLIGGMPLQLFEFTDLPLQFIVSELCHYNFTTLSNTPLLILSLCF